MQCTKSYHWEKLFFLIELPSENRKLIGHLLQIGKNPKSTAVDNIILESRRKQDELDNMTRLTREQAYIDLKNTWDRYKDQNLKICYENNERNTSMASSIMSGRQRGS